MSETTKTAGVAGTIKYAMNVTPFSAPVMRIYSDAARTILVQGPTTMTATAAPNRFTTTYSAALPAGVYFFRFSTVIADGEPALDDEDDSLILLEAIGSVNTSGGPCEPWATAADMCSPCNDYAIPSADLDENLVIASEYLFNASGRQFAGVCSRTVRPCGRSSVADFGYANYWWGSWTWHSSWGFCACGNPSSCGCEAGAEIGLPGGPIIDVTEILIDGAVVDPASYTVYDGRRLVRMTVDGVNEGWPVSQRLDLPTSETGTFSVSYRYGRPPPQLGVRAAARLACELTLLCDPELLGRCSIPRNVLTMTRAGVTIDMDKFGQSLSEGRTGLAEVDLFLATFNPKRLPFRSTVHAPGMGRKGRTSG